VTVLRQSLPLTTGSEDLRVQRSWKSDAEILCKDSPMTQAKYRSVSYY